MAVDVALVAGLAVGAVVLIGIILVLIWILCRRKSAKNQRPDPENTSVTGDAARPKPRVSGLEHAPGQDDIHKKTQDRAKPGEAAAAGAPSAGDAGAEGEPRTFSTIGSAWSIGQEQRPAMGPDWTVWGSGHVDIVTAGGPSKSLSLPATTPEGDTAEAL